MHLDSFIFKTVQESNRRVLWLGKATSDFYIHCTITSAK